MKAERSSRCCSSRTGTRAALIAVAMLSAASPGCVRKANVVMVPIPIQIVGGDSRPKIPLVGQRWNRVEAGMGKDEVIHFVGEPTRRDYEGSFSNGSVETWYYDSYDLHDGTFDPHYVRFDRGRVVYSAIDERRLKEAHSTELASERRVRIDKVIPPDVGFHCDSGEQCQSKSCVDNKCAGPRGCTRPSGADCLTDSDCCSQQCIAARFCK